jgi:hypothetical protein
MKTRALRSPLAYRSQVVDLDWVTFNGGELQGKRPTVLCSTCREKLHRAAAAHDPSTTRRALQLLCFQCYRATLDRNRALKAAGDLDTATPERFQFVLPLEPVNRSRLTRLRVERSAERSAARAGSGLYADKRRRAQIAARHALQRLMEGLRERNAGVAEQRRAVADSLHAAELQLPEAWMSFVAGR